MTQTIDQVSAYPVVTLSDQEPTTRKKPVTRRALLALAVTAGAGLSLLTTACSSGGTAEGHDTTPSPTSTTVEATPTHEQLTPSEMALPTAVKDAINTLDILGLTGSGAESDVTKNSNGYFFSIGNKAALVGSDYIMGTPDDSEYRGYPEIHVVYDAYSNIIFVRATQSDEDGNVFWRTVSSFSAGQSNPIADTAKTDQPLTVSDFKNALQHPGVTLQSTEANNGQSVSQNVSIDFGPDGDTRLCKVGLDRQECTPQIINTWENNITGAGLHFNKVLAAQNEDS